MSVDEALAVLESLRPERKGLRSVVEERNGLAGMVLEHHEGAERWAAVSTPGTGWFTLQLDGGFMYDIVDEDASSEEIREILQHLIAIGQAYLEGKSELTTSRFLKAPTRIVQLGDQRIRIHLSLDKLWRRIWGRS
ncbi:hypothetical protein GCM10009775_19930 [Microbacterium aoyamense]|uniref:Immunity protein 63 domain-containing protein n=1 Tax=Microbacterium aoyamense TaxID=344166 RepID=A0ABN2PQM9_9MICO|nr:hypothetical protein [Microbacterium aoyamense]